MFKAFFLILFFLAFMLAGFPQPEATSDPYLKFDRYSVKNGLSGNTITAIHQDTTGFLWVATTDGLNRFDGYRFDRFLSDPEDSTSLTDNHVGCIETAADGALWIGTKQGLNRLQADTWYFTNHKNSQNPLFNQSHIRAIRAGKTGFLWIETADGQLWSYKPGEEQVEKYAHDGPSMVDTYFYHSILEDEQGQVWVGGRYMGMMSFDPTTEALTKIATGADGPEKKRDPDVAVYFIDSKGTFWVGGIDGLYTYNREKGTFTKKLAVSTFALLEDASGRLWAGTGSGLYIFDEDRQAVRYTVHDDNNTHSLCHNHITSLFMDRSRNIWIGTIDGLCVFRPSKNKFGHIYHIPGNEESPVSGNITSILEDRAGNLWLGTADRGIDVFSQNFEKIATCSASGTGTYKLASDRISVIREDGEGAIWVGQWSGRGMNIIDQASNTSRRFQFLQTGLMADWYADILHDRAGNHWIGLWGAQGFYQFDKEFHTVTDERFSPLALDPDVPVKKLAFDGRRLWLALESQNRFWCYDTKTLRFNYIQENRYNSYPFSRIEAILISNGTPWFITDAGNYRVDYTPYLEFQKTSGRPPGSHENRTTGDIPDAIGDTTHVYKVLKTGPQTTWVATSKGLLMLQEGLVRVFSHSQSIPGWRSDTIYDLAILPGDLLALATGKGLVLFDMADQTCTHPGSYADRYLSSRLIKFLFEDREESIWIGTTDAGLNRYFPETGQVVNYPNRPQDPDGFWGKQASCAIQDKQGNLWIGGTGINLFEPLNETFRHFTEAEGLADNDVRSLLADRSGRIWAGTANGLSCLDPASGLIINYAENDGLQDNEFTSAAAVLKDGRLAFGGKNGLNLFDPDRVAYNDQKPPILVTGFSLFEEPQETLPGAGRPLKLKYNENYFSFEFTALDFSDPARNVFAYKLEGLEEDWIHTTAQNRVARYTNVDPGNYLFTVKAANSDGTWNEQGISIPLTIRPPFWRTNAFYGMLVLLSAGMIVLAVRYRERKIKEQNQVLLLEQKLLRSQMNPHFIFNSLSSIQSYMFESNPVTAGSYLSQFAELIRSILYNSREEFIALDKEINTLKNYLELQQLRYNNKFDYTITVDPELETEAVSIPPMLAQPFIENAIEHGIKHIEYRGSIQIEFLQDGNTLLFRLADNGIGLEAAKKIKNSKAGEHRSLATVITRERIEILNKSNRTKAYAVTIEEIQKNGTVQGTRVKFRLPLTWIDA